MEIWKQIEQTPYYVSNEGNIKDSRNGKLKKLYNVRGSYQYSCNYKNKRYRGTPTSFLCRYFPYWWINQLEEGETCSPLEGYNKYFVTTYGRVFSNHTGCWLKPYHIPTTYQPPYYYRVGIGGGKEKYLHTLVGRTFLPEYQEGLFILHRDENLPYPEINFLSNLWVGTNSENQLDRYAKGR